MPRAHGHAALLLAIATVILGPAKSAAQLPPYLRDRGTGIPTSQFGTYVRPGELIIYPLYEYYYDKNLEYEPADYGYGSIQELRGRYQAHEGILFLAYGISDRLALELEGGVITAKFDKSPDDTTALPAALDQAGLSDVEGQLRWRLNHETATKPEYFTFFETVFPTGDKDSLIGTSSWELALGAGLVRGFSWGTATVRLALEYDTGEGTVGNGYAVEYLRRLSDHFRFFGMLEGSDDEIALVPEIQWFLGPGVLLKAAFGVGVTSKATDFAPELGLMFFIPVK